MNSIIKQYIVIRDSKKSFDYCKCGHEKRKENKQCIFCSAWLVLNKKRYWKRQMNPILFKELTGVFIKDWSFKEERYFTLTEKYYINKLNSQTRNKLNIWKQKN
jgi:hypothetical protein